MAPARSPGTWRGPRLAAVGTGASGDTGDRPPSALGGRDGWRGGWERNNKAVNHDTKHAFILFTKTAWIAKTLQTAFQFNDVERAGETGI